jgi:hypothetical protein
MVTAFVLKDQLVEGWYLRQLHSRNPVERNRAALMLSELKSQKAIGPLLRLSVQPLSREDIAGCLRPQFISALRRIRPDLPEPHTLVFVKQDEAKPISSDFDRMKELLEKWVAKESPLPAFGVPPIDGEVIQVNDDARQTVILSAGSDQGVKVGFRVAIGRKDEFIAHVEIVRVFLCHSIGKIVGVSEGKKVQTGDWAATQI